MDTLDPSTGRVIAEVPVTSADEVDIAVRAANDAAGAWGRLPARGRSAALRSLADAIRAESERLAQLDARNAGITIAIARRDAKLGLERLEYFADIAHEVDGRTYPAPPGSAIRSTRHPFGVVASINPYNHPLMFALSKAAAPLAAGNTVVIKPPDQAPLSTLAIAEIAADALPPGVVSVVTGPGQPTGSVLAGHPLVRKVTFTGSVETGRLILQATAPNIAPAILELGGKNAFIVLPDADLDAAIEGAVAGMNLGVCGQSCQSGTRAFLHEAIHDEFLRGLLDRLSHVRIGLATEETTEMGPLISERQRSRVLEYIESGHAQGARLVAGGAIPGDEALSGGFFIEPTVFDGVDTGMRIAQEEIFGPVLSVLTWTDQGEMLRGVNGLELGLTASVWTTSQEGTAVADEIEAGYVYINKHGGAALGVPFGGWKRSGMGVEHSVEELLDFTQFRVVDQKT